MTTANPQLVQKAGKPSDSLVNERSWMILALLCVAQFINVLNAQSVQLVLPELAQAFGFTTDQLQWVVSLNVLAFGGGLLVAGRLADCFGHRRIFLYGLLLCAFGSLIGGLALAPWILLLARTLLGLSTALMVPAAFALLVDTFPEGKYRHRALGIWGGVGQVGGITGTLLGTLLVDHFGWPTIFLLNVPLVLLTLLLIPRWITRTPRPVEHVPVDVRGGLLVSSSVVLLMVGLTQLAHAAVPLLILLPLFIGSFVLFLLFCWLETRLKHPLVPVGMFRHSHLVASCLIQLIFATNSTLFFFTLYMQQMRGFSSFLTGLAFLPTNLMLIGGSLLTARLIKWLGYRYSLLAGLSFMTLSALLLAGMSLTGSYLWTLLPGLLVLGLGHGITGTTVTVAGTEQIPLDERGIASSLINMSYQIGSAIGLAVLITLATLHTLQLAGGSHASSADLIGGFQWAFYAQAGFEVLAIILTIVMMRPSFTKKR